MKSLKYGETAADSAEGMGQLASLASAISGKGGVNAVSVKENVIYLKVKSLHMMPNYRFLSMVFDVFSKYKVSADTVTTSEVGVSVIIDSEDSLSDILEELQDYATLEVSRDMAVISVEGSMECRDIGFCASVVEALKDIPVRMISYGVCSRISIVVRSADKYRALESLSCNELL